MERLSETIRIREFKAVEKLPAFAAELPQNSKNMARDIEKLYSDIATKINWLLSNKLTIEAHTSDDTLKAVSYTHLTLPTSDLV